MNKGYEVQVGHENRMDFDRHYSKWMAAEVGHCVTITIIQHETLDGFVYYPLPKVFLDYLDKHGVPYVNMGYRENP